MQILNFSLRSKKYFISSDPMMWFIIPAFLLLLLMLLPAVRNAQVPLPMPSPQYLAQQGLLPHNPQKSIEQILLRDWDDEERARKGEYIVE